jgi:CheY-like chemotaxis protein
MAKGRVLIVDDSKFQRSRMSAILVEGGYEVLVADDGLIGFQTAVKERPDIIISDISMPTLDGIGFCKALKEHGATRSTPVVFLSALDSMDDLVKGLEAGASDYLSKQTDGPEQLLAMTEVHVAYSRKVREARLQTGSSETDAAPVGEEMRAVHDLPVSFFEGLSFGLAIANLRRRPIYMNRAARELLGYSITDPVASLGGSDFETLLAAVAKAYPEQRGSFFYSIEHRDLRIGVHLEQVFSSRNQICGVMLCLARAPG